MCFTKRAYRYKKACDQKEISWIELTQLSSNQEGTDTKVFLATKFSENGGCSDTSIFTINSDMANLVTFYVGKINCHLMIRIAVGLKVLILDTGTSKPLDDILEILPALPMLFQAPIL